MQLAPGNWIPTAERLPQPGQKIEWISPGGQHERGTFEGGAVWYPDGSSAYIYYTPTFWRPADQR